MTTETGQTPTAEPAERGQASDKKQPPVKPPPADSASADKKPSNAELKKKKQEEKQARRAQAKAVQAPPAAAAASPSAATDGAKAKAKPKSDGLQPVVGVQKPAHPAISEPTSSVPECFSHLSMAKRISMTQADKDVHPVILALGQQMATFAIRDSITRLQATLLAFKRVIQSYTTPLNTTLSRHFTTHVLNPQIVHLTASRPMCFSMGNAIRWLKLQISKIDPDTPDADAKRQLLTSIDAFIHERVTLADLVITTTASSMITDGDVVLTYAHHHLVERALLRAHASGTSFSVLLLDDPFDRVGVEHAKSLAAAGIPVSYSPGLGALRTHLLGCTAVLVAAEAMFSNGAMYATAGTCDIATAAADLGLRVISLCETINFTERVSIDSLTYNEIDPERGSNEEFRLLFDTTREEHISAIVTELGICAAKSVPEIMRKFDEL